VAEARRYGLEAEAQTDLTLADLERELARGSLVIVAVQAWADHAVPDWRTNWEDGHYVVVVGLSNERVYVMDPSVRTGYAYLTRSEFLARWHDYDKEGTRKTVYDRLGIVIRGDAQLYMAPIPTTKELSSTGKVRALAINSAKRVPQLPDVPTIAETLPEYKYDSWFAVFAPHGTPQAILDKAAKDIATVLEMPDVKEKLIAQGSIPAPTTPAELDAMNKADTERYSKILRDAGVTPQ